MTSSLPREVASGLATIVGAEHTLTREATGSHAVDGVVPHCVVFPGTTDEVSRCLALAWAADLAVVPTGRGTRLGWGASPRAVDLVLSLRRLEHILAHEPADLTASVEAGVTLGRLNAALRPHRQFLPLDPAGGEGSTIGGIIATGATGPYRARYGTIRDLLLGLTIVQPDGTIVTGGGRVVKNATGYDMPKLHVGALGTLGVIVAAHLRLHPAAVVEATSLFGFASPEAAHAAALAIMDAPLAVSRLQLLDRTMLTVVGDPDAASAALAVSVGSVPEGVRAQGERINEICGRSGGTTIPLPEQESWWARVSDASWPADPPTTMTLRIGCRATDVVKAFRALQAAAGSTVAVGASVEVVNGVLHAVIVGRGVDDGAALLRRLRDAIAPLEATCVVEHAPLAIKAALDVWGDIGPALPVMRRLKAEFDPKGILNAGRFVGGI